MCPKFSGLLGKILIILALPMYCGQSMARPAVKQIPQYQGTTASEIPDSNSEYMNMISRLERMDADGQRATLVSDGFFSGLSWIGRTACLNYVCGVLSTDLCRRALELGLKDEALVVRDHALRITISAKQLTEVEKRIAAERMVEDSRNYRKGRPFWIVDRARGFLVAESGNSTAR
ncbi:MAG: hypothetical protein RLZZ488_1998 [Pseudomonadota bacterium]|jgi:hypothetical protein